MNEEKTYKIDIRVTRDIKRKYTELGKYFDLNNTKLMEKIVNDLYEKEIVNHSNSLSQDEKKGCMMHMCKIVNIANGITDDDIRKELLEEVEVTCQILR